MSLEHYIANSTERFAEVERAISAFDFAHGEQSQYQQLNREYQRLKQLLDFWQQYQKARQGLQDNAELLEQTEDEAFRELILADIAELEKREAGLDREIKTLILPPHPNEGRDVIIEIRPAAGGDEAGLFAADLLRMYSRYAELKGWRQEILDLTDTPLGGLKNASFTLRGDGAWSTMRFESGVHRVQRIPVTEAQGRIHTSTVTVAVLAEAEEVDFELKPEDLRIDVFRASGHGGQCVNTTDSAVRVTHLPTGLFVASQQEKSQHRNKEIAMRILRARLLEAEQSKEDAKNAAERRSQVGSGDRSERSRTYNFPQNRVTDHRYDITLYELNSIMEGNLDELLGEIRAIEANRRLAEELNI
ncbi:MAG: peptide chain release factor 1 [Lentisphaeria bacterium]